MPKSMQGFACLTPEERKRVASKGAKAAHAKGTAHKFTKEEAIEAGRKGGRRSQALGKSHRFTSETGRLAALKRKSRKPPTIYTYTYSFITNPN